MIPEYIRNAKVQNNELLYTWDEWNLESNLGPFDKDKYALLKALSLRAGFAMLVGAAEWVVYRLDPFMSTETLPIDAIEAGWAQEIDYRYALPWNPFEEWKGPVFGPVKKVCMLMSDAADYLGKRVDVARPAAKVLAVASHVLQDNSAYKEWENQILRRLAGMYPLIPDDPLGDPVPRQALDPDIVFDVSESEMLINSFLVDLDYEENPFLSKPDQMLEWGFEGKPYAYDLVSDRRLRREA